MIPVAGLATAAILWPNPILAVLLPPLAIAPMVGALVPPVERLVRRYVGPVGGWFLRHSVRGDDGRTWGSLLRAIRGDPQLRADSRRIEDPSLVIDAERRHAERILAVPAPDVGWSRAIRVVATPHILYREMLEGKRPLDDEHLRAVIANADEELRAFVRSRSTPYRILSLRYGDERGEK